MIRKREVENWDKKRKLKKMRQYEKVEEAYIFPSILWEFKYPDAPNDQFIKWVYDASNADVRFQQGTQEAINTGLGKIGTDSISVFSEQYPRAGNSASGGWQSGSFTMEQTEFYPLIEFVWYIVEEVARTVGISYIDCQIAMWANLNYPYCYNGIHSHPSAHYSGVYYAQVPEGDCGWRTSPGCLRAGIGLDADRNSNPNRLK